MLKSWGYLIEETFVGIMIDVNRKNISSTKDDVSF